MNKVCIGIDLGSSSTKAAYVVADAEKRRAVPSSHAVQFHRGGGVHDTRLPSVAAQLPRVARAGAQRAGGRRQGRSALLRQGHNLFRLDRPLLGEQRIYPFSCDPTIRSPEDVASMILARVRSALKAAAGGVDIKSSPVAIAVPVTFGPDARRSIIEAAAMAGFNPALVQLIDEEAAAVIHALSDPETAAKLSADPGRTVMLFNCGRDASDFDMFRCRPDEDSACGFTFERFLISKYPLRGDATVDAAITNWFLWDQVEARIGRRRRNLAPDLRQSIQDTLVTLVAPKLKERLCREIERLRRRGVRWDDLGKAVPKAKFTLPATFKDGRHPNSFPLKYELSFNDLQRTMDTVLPLPTDQEVSRQPDGFRQLVKRILSALTAPGVGLKQLDVILYHGAACRNPFIRRSLDRIAEYSSELGFGEPAVLPVPDLDTSVAQGAALAAYWQHEVKTVPIRPIMAEDVVVRAQDHGQDVAIIPAGTALPCVLEASAGQFTVADDKQSGVTVHWRVGDREHGRTGLINLDFSQVPAVIAGDPIAIRLRVGLDGSLLWSYSIAHRPFCDAERIAYPWPSAQTMSERKALVEHRVVQRTWLAEHPGQRLPIQYSTTEAHLCALIGDHEVATLLLADCLRVSRTASIANALALSCAESGHEALALKYGDMALRLAPADPTLVGHYGSYLLDAGRCEQAIHFLRAALVLDPNQPSFCLFLADALDALDRADEASTVRWQALRLLSSDPASSRDTENLTMIQAAFTMLGLERNAEDAIRRLHGLPQQYGSP